MGLRVSPKPVAPIDPDKEAMGMSEKTGQVISFSLERDRRIHDVYDKRLEEVRHAFDQAFPQAKNSLNKKSARKKSPKKKR